MTRLHKFGHRVQAGRPRTHHSDACRSAGLAAGGDGVRHADLGAC
ncbi:MAG: hypothetical protein WA965_29270 [Mycobacterium sp.]